ncbi:nucleophile aminohydrolase [Mycena filopes]|nr:nucleophile aminohydrolase [Mycena filopes]
MSSKVAIDWAKVDAPELSFARFPSRRSVVYSTKGVVAASQPLAVEAGLEILRKGGNAADAAVATSAALAVTEPSSCGIGGDAFCLFFDAKTKTVKALNGSGRSPQKLTMEYVRGRGLSGISIPSGDINAATVPGATAAWIDTVERFGSGNVTFAEVLEPAIRLAEDGVPVSEIASHAWQESENLIKTASPNGAEMLLNGKAPRPGQIMRFPNLARTFREVAAYGKNGFYKGRIAQAIVDLDLAGHETAFVVPIRYTYADEVTLWECPPNGQGLTALIALGILESLQEEGTIRPLFEMEHNSAEYLHILIEALRLAFSDTQWYVADPALEHIPVEKLLSKEYLAARAKLIDPLKQNAKVVHGHPENSSDTVYFTVADQWGNACSYIQSNYTDFGTGAIPTGCGFTLQSRGSCFTLADNHPNGLKGGKRPYHTIIPAMATRGDDLFLSYGVMGGYIQPQGHVQVLLGMLRGYTPQAALDSPRFCIAAKPTDSKLTNPDAGDLNGPVYFEEGIPLDTIDKLREMGHDAQTRIGFERSLFGRGQVIQRLEDRLGRVVWAAGSEEEQMGNNHAVVVYRA